MERIAVCGSVHVDVFADVRETGVFDARGEISLAVGGTAFNIAQGLRFLGCEVSLLSVLKRGSILTRLILHAAEKAGIGMDSVKILENLPEAGFVVLRESGEPVRAVNSTPIEQLEIGAPEWIGSCLTVCVDFNCSTGTVKNLVEAARSPVYLHLVSEAKSVKILDLVKSGLGSTLEEKVAGIFLNRHELAYILKAAGRSTPVEILRVPWIVTMDRDGVAVFGPDGCVRSYENRVEERRKRFYSGAGDCFAAGFIYGREVLGQPEEACVATGYAMVERNIGRRHSGVSPDSLLMDTDRIIFRDPLTGLLTRAYLEEELRLGESERRGRCMSAIFIDIDHFKRVNDTCGHATGDRVLKTVAQIVMSCIRRRDRAIRYGGEELLVLLPGTQPADAMLVAERIRRQVERSEIPAGNGTIRVTVSAGVSGGKKPVREMILEADSALYSAKRSGRNRVVCSSV